MGVFVETGELCASGDRLHTIRSCIGILSQFWTNPLFHVWF